MRLHGNATDWPKCPACGVVSTRDGTVCSTCTSKAAVQGHPYVPGERATPGQMDSWVACAECQQPRWMHSLWDGTRDLAVQLESAARNGVAVLPHLQRAPGETEEAHHHALARVRHGDPLTADHSYLARAARPTSADAAERARLTSGGQRRRVMQAIVDAGDRGATDEELQHELALSPNSETPRRLELVEAGYVMDSGDERATASGARAIVWLPTLAGLQALEAEEVAGDG